MIENTQNSKQFKIDGEVVTVEIFGRRIGYKTFRRLVSAASFFTGAIFTAAMFIPFYYGFLDFKYYAFVVLAVDLFGLPFVDSNIKSRYQPLSYTEEKKLHQPRQLSV